jgi:hypothetical protein
MEENALGGEGWTGPHKMTRVKVKAKRQEWGKGCKKRK